MSEGHETEGDRGVGDALREAVERTLQATAGSAATTRDRATELVDEIARRGRDARGGLSRRGQAAGAELARRGQGAGAELARRGQDAGAELARRLEALEQRLAEVEEGLRAESDQEGAEGSVEPEQSRPSPEPPSQAGPKAES